MTVRWCLARLPPGWSGWWLGEAGGSVRLVAVLLAAAVAWVLTGPAPALRRLAGRERDRRTGPTVLTGIDEPAGLTGLATTPERDRGLVAAVRLRRAGLRHLAGRRSQVQLSVSLGEVLTGLASGLVTGAAPRDVLADAAAGLPGLDELAATARSPTGDLPGALDRLGRRSGGGAAADLALLWRLAERTGCSLAGPVQRLRDADRGEAAVRRELAAQLAGPRATGRLLAGLPVVGVALGAGLGADPLGFLLGTSAGAACLAVGGVLVLLGLLWTRALVRSVEPGRGKGLGAR